MHVLVRASSAMARPESVHRPIYSARCSRRAPGSTRSMCPIAAKLLRSEDLIAGRIPAMFPIVPDVIAAIRADQVRALALAANSASGILPNVPPMPQLGYPDLIASAWVALYAPASTPASIIERLRAQLDAV